MSVSKFLTQDECSAEAIEKGLEAFFALPGELMLDLDEGAELHMGVRGCLISNSIGITGELWTISKSGHKHVYLRTDRDWTMPERVAMQASLGSDPKKEALTIIGERGFSALYELPAEAVRVKEWRVSFTVPELEELAF